MQTCVLQGSLCTLECWQLDSRAGHLFWLFLCDRHLPISVPGWEWWQLEWRADLFGFLSLFQTPSYLCLEQLVAVAGMIWSILVFFLWAATPSYLSCLFFAAGPQLSTSSSSGLGLIIFRNSWMFDRTVIDHFGNPFKGETLHWHYAHFVLISSQFLRSCSTLSCASSLFWTSITSCHLHNSCHVFVSVFCFWVS